LSEYIPSNIFGAASTSIGNTKIHDSSSTRAILDISNDYTVEPALVEPKPPKLDLLLKAQALAAQKNKQKLKNFRYQTGTSKLE
jgi:hypothetical protein